MDILQVFLHNILSPAVLFFILGLSAGFFKSDLEIPDSISSYLSIYLMMSIGFKGGATLAAAPHFDLHIILTMASALLIGLLQPFLAYGLLTLTTRLDKVTAAAVSAHYGSISLVTFATAVSFLKLNNLNYMSIIVVILALMEAPAILSGLFIAHRVVPETRTHAHQERRLMFEIFTNGAILLLLGSFLIGFLTGHDGLEKMEPFLITPFQGVLALFLLDMGLLVSKNLHHLEKFSFPLFAFAIYMPLLGAAIGIGASYALGLDKGSAFLFTILCASASYIAVPAAMRLALPEAKAGIYVPMSIGLTFPFNILIGVPLYYMAISWVFQ